MSSEVPAATVAMSVFCLSALDCHLRGLPVPRCPEDIPNTPCRVFVSYLDKSHADALRGCIGCIAGTPLRTLLGEYAIRAAQDSRFPRVALKELPNLICEVHILTPNEPIGDVYDWEAGVHGLAVEFQVQHPYGSRFYSAEYLPCVARQTGWDKEHLVETLIQKAGYSGPVTPELLASVTSWRYEDTAARATYNDYLAAQSANAGGGSRKAPRKGSGGRRSSRSGPFWLGLPSGRHTDSSYTADSAEPPLPNGREKKPANGVAKHTDEGAAP